MQSLGKEKRQSSTDTPLYKKAVKALLQCRDVIIAVGRGASDRQSLYLIEQLAKMMHASIGCSRAVVDAGVLDARFQIGQTGQIVRPKLYLAFGISGASQHICGYAGCKGGSCRQSES